MKIVRIIARLNVGGPARHVVWLTKGLQDNEFQSILIAGMVPKGEEDMRYIAEANGVTPIFIAEMSRELSFRDIVSLYKIYGHIKKEEPDIIHTHTAKAGTLGRLAALFYRWLTWRTFAGRPRKVRIIHTFHGHVFHSYYGMWKTRIFIAIEKILARIATDKIIAISPQQFREIHGAFGIGRAAQFEVVPLGLDLEPFIKARAMREAFREEIGVNDDEMLIGFVGRLTEIKNVSLLLQVAHFCGKKTKNEIPKLRFVIAGDGHLRQSLENEAYELGVDQFVTFLGNRTDTESIYAGIDIIALTSLNEGTPLSLIEGMASAKAVVSTAVGGVVDLLGEIEQQHDGFAVRRRGVTVESKSAQGFLEGLIYLLKNKELRDNLGKHGKHFVEAEFCKERLIRDMKAVYRNLIQ